MSNINIQQFYEKSVWESQLKKYANPLLLESGSNSLTAFAIIEAPNIVIGASFEERSVYPKVKSFHNSNCYFIGIDNRLIIVDAKNINIISIIDLDSFFVDAFETKQDCVVIFEETGIGLYEFSGKKIWYTPTDLLDKYFVDDDIITICDGSTKIKLSILSGKTVN